MPCLTSRVLIPQQAPPPAEIVKVDSVTTHEVVSGVHLVRGNCASRLKYEVEYNLKRGTTDNTYILKVSLGAIQHASDCSSERGSIGAQYAADICPLAGPGCGGPR